MSSLVQLDGPSFAKFHGAIRSPYTKRVYHCCLVEFVDFLYGRDMIPAKSIDCLLVKDCDLIENWMIAWIGHQKERGLSVSVMHVRKSAVKLFYDVNKVQGIAWKIVAKHMGENRILHDRPYTIDEIRKMLDKSDFRGRVVILLLASTGMRVGAVPELKWRNIERIEKYGLYKITVYEGTSSEYVTFCTPECAKAIDEYIEFRKRHREALKPESPLIREQFDRAEAMRDFGKASHARHVTVGTIRDLIRDALLASGLREARQMERVDASRLRHVVKQSHGFRKFYDTTVTQAGVHPLYTEMLLGHDLSLKGAYFRPSAQDLLEGNDRMMGYASAIDSLTVNEENKLRIKVAQLEKSSNRESINSDAIASLADQVMQLAAEVSELRKKKAQEHV